jgi:uncharacterized cofD-like protein
VCASKEAIQTLKKADIIIMGPATFYTSLVASLLPSGIPEALRTSKAKKIFIANAANFPQGHCDGYTLETYLWEIRRLFDIQFTAILAHDGSHIPKKERVSVTPATHITIMDVLDTPKSEGRSKFDTIERNTLRHDGEKVVKWIKKFFD